MAALDETLESDCWDKDYSLPESDPVCYYCEADLESEVRRNSEAAADLLLNLKKRDPRMDVTECEALSRGLVCSKCIEERECPYCTQLGGERIERRGDIRCSLCVSTQEPEYSHEEHLDTLRRRRVATRQQGILFEREVA